MFNATVLLVCFVASVSGQPGRVISACRDRIQWDFARDQNRLEREFDSWSLDSLPGEGLRWRFVPKTVHFNDLFLRVPIEERFQDLIVSLSNSGEAFDLGVKLRDAQGSEWTVRPMRVEQGQRQVEVSWSWFDFHPASWSSDQDGVLNLPCPHLAVIAFGLEHIKQYELVLHEVKLTEPPPLRVEVLEWSMPRQVKAGEELKGRISVRLLSDGIPLDHARLCLVNADQEMHCFPMQIVDRPGEWAKGERRTLKVREQRIHPYACGGAYRWKLVLAERTASLERKGESMEAPEANIEARTPGRTVAEVRRYRGAPTLFINGEPHCGMAYAAYRPSVEVFQQFAEAGVDLFSICATPTESGYGLSRLAWLAEDVFDFSQLDERVLMVLQANRDAYVFPRIYLHAPAWWAEKHPDEMVTFDPGDGQPVPFMHAGEKRAPCWASVPWREDTAMALRKLIEHVKSSPYADRIVGYHISSGTTEEWMQWGSNENQWVDYSPANLRAFRRYLARKYATDRALQAAWRNGRVTLNTAAIPTKSQRVACRLGTVRDPSSEQSSVDYYLYNSEMTAETISLFARVIKDATQGEKLVGAFYGYVLQLAGEQRQQNAGHLALRTLWDCPYIDFLSSPTSYAFRDVGTGTSHIMSLPSGVQLAGKLWFDENDIRTSLAPGKVGGWGKQETVEGDILQQRRELGSVLSRGMAQWWFDVGGNRYDTPPLMDELQELVTRAKELVEADRSPIDEVAFVVDAQSLAHLKVGNRLSRSLLMEQIPRAGRIGAPVGWYELSDLKRLPARKMYVFLGVLAPGEEDISRIRGLAETGATLLFVYGAAVYREEQFDPALSERILGFPLSYVQEKRALKVCLDKEHEWTKSLQDREYGAIQETEGWFLPPEGEGEVLGRLADGRAGLILRETGEGRILFSAAPRLSSSFLKECARRAGVHLYIDTQDVVWGSKGLLAMNVAEVGKRVVRLPEERSVVEVFSGQQVSDGCLSFETSCPAGGTLLWKLDKPQSRLASKQDAVRESEASDTSRGWLPPDEVSPFFPDGGMSLQPNAENAVHDAVFGKSFSLKEKPLKAALALTGLHMASATLNGSVVLEAQNEGVVRVPSFAKVSNVLRKGKNRLEIRCHTPWMAWVYAQLRMEGEEGRTWDLVTDNTWEWRSTTGETWGPVHAVDDYYGTLGKAGRFEKTFALMPRKELSQWLRPHNRALKRSWPKDRHERAEFRGAYERPEYAKQYQDFLKIEQGTGQLRDASGRMRHLFFTIYEQKRETGNDLDVWSFDYDQLERDLELMERSHVHVYLRFTGWHKLLDEDGGWQGCEESPAGSHLPDFERNVEVLDYFLDRCQAHGRFVFLEGDFFWWAHWDVLPAPYHERYFLYPEAMEANALAHRKIYARYRDRPVLAGVVIGEEDLIMASDLHNEHLAQEFRATLKKRYGTVEELERTWHGGYETSFPENYKLVQRRPDYWGEDAPKEEVFEPCPRYRVKEGCGWKNWSDVPLPAWPRYRTFEPPHTECLSHRSFNQFTPNDPAWIEYNALKEDDLYLASVSCWAGKVREALPHQILFHSNAQDFTNQWHFLHFFRRAQLPFDVIGVGSHDTGKGLEDIPSFERRRKYYRVIASYRPYVLSIESPAIGIASGEGAGGRLDDPLGILDYYRDMSFFMVGHGASFELSYSWGVLSGAEGDPDRGPYLTPALEWMGSFYEVTKNVSFNLSREVPLLIARNNHLQRSNRSGREYGNVQGLVDALGQLNLEFDAVMDEDLVLGSVPGKVDLSRYRVIFLPCLDCPPDPAFLEHLSDWLEQATQESPRGLVLGRILARDRFLAPTDAFDPILAQWVDTERYEEGLLLEAGQPLLWTPTNGGGEASKIRLNWGDRDIERTGVLSSGEPILQTEQGKTIGAARKVGHAWVFSFGFPLGLAHDLLWGMPAEQEPYDVLAKVYEDLIETCQVSRPLRPPHNVHLCLSDDGSLLLAQELYGLHTDELGVLKLPQGSLFQGCESEPVDGKGVRLRAELNPFEGRFFKRKIAP